MALRSKPIQLIQRKTSAGTVTYRVTGSPYPGGKQLKFVSTSYEEAEEQRQIWEELRMRGASASRPKQTHLTIQQIRESEAVYPPTPKAVCPGIPKIFTELRKMFQLPHDSLRHTAISAFVSEGNDYSDAADLRHTRIGSIYRVRKIDIQEFGIVPSRNPIKL